MAVVVAARNMLATLFAGDGGLADVLDDVLGVGQRGGRRAGGTVRPKHERGIKEGNAE